MKTVSLLALAVLALAQIATAELTAEEAAEQQELLAWARTLQLQARDDQALGVCDMILQVDPESADAYLRRAMILLGESRFDDAIADLDRALRFRKDDPLALAARAHAWTAVGELDRGQSDARRSAEMAAASIAAEAADAIDYYARGLARVLLEHREALQDFAAAASLDEKLVEAHVERAHIFVGTGRLEEALGHLTRAVETRPDYAVGVLSRAHVHYEMSNFQEALADCDRALQINDHYARAWHNRGLINVQIADLRSAIQDFTQAILVQPGYASAHYYRGEAYLTLGTVASARAGWETASEVAPDEWAGQAAAEMLRQLRQQQGEAAD